MRKLASDLLIDLRRLATTTEDLTKAVAASGTTLTTLLGIGDLMAAKILARTGSIHRFRSAAAFASFCGSRRSKCPQATFNDTGSRAPVIAN